MTHHRILLADIENVPEIDEHASTNREEGEKADHLASKGARKENTCKAQPPPPFTSELAVIEVRQRAGMIGEEHAYRYRSFLNRT